MPLSTQLNSHRTYDKLAQNLAFFPRYHTLYSMAEQCEVCSVDGP
jgi:hypothetical protein